MINSRYERAQLLWPALVRAKVEGTPRTLAHIQDFVFRLYLPLARGRAREAVPQTTVHLNAAAAAADQDAEMGLAQAVVCWPYPHGRGFEPFALDMIDSRLRSSTPPAPTRAVGAIDQPAELAKSGARLYALPALPSAVSWRPGSVTRGGAESPPVGVSGRSAAQPNRDRVYR